MEDDEDRWGLAETSGPSLRARSPPSPARSRASTANDVSPSKNIKSPLNVAWWVDAASPGPDTRWIVRAPGKRGDLDVRSMADSIQPSRSSRGGASDARDSRTAKQIHCQVC